MNTKQDRKRILKKLISKLLSLEIERNVLNQDLNAINLDLTYLDSIKDDLIFNIRFLQGDDIVVIMKEYHRSINQLKEIRVKTIEIKDLQTNLQKKLDKKITEHENCFKKLEKKFYEQERHNILKFPHINKKINE